MPDNPKNPNVWWTQKISHREMFPVRWSDRQKKHLFWIVPLFLLLVTTEIYFLNKLQHMR